MIRVRVSLFGDVNRYLHGRPKEHEQEMTDGATVQDLLTALAIPPQNELTIGVNGELSKPQTTLRDGDKVMLATPMEGG